MHFNFRFTAVETLWTLNFAAMLVLLVVLLGRERIRRFPIFTSSIVLIGLNMLAQNLLAHRLAPLVSTTMFLVLADLGVMIALLLAIELARRAFSTARWPAWVAGSLILLGGATAVMVFWGQWPAAKTVFDRSTLGHLRLMQLIEEKGDMFNEVLAVELFALVVVAGRLFKTGWRSHTQQILAGVSATSAMVIIERVIWQAMTHNMPRTREGYNHMIDLQSDLLNANSMVLLAAMIWWIVCLWVDEPGTTPVAAGGDAPANTAADTPERWLENPSDTGAAPGA